MWAMPMDEEYKEQLKTPFADLANIGGPPPDRSQRRG